MNNANGARPDGKTAFCGKAEAYAKARPGYPDAAYDYIASLLPPSPVVADVGAGTGKFTLPMARRGWTVYAVEPNDEMRAYLAGQLTEYQNAYAINGTAEETGLPSGLLDAVTCAQALHWFDAELFRKECGRILKPGGLIIAVYNITRSNFGGRRDTFDISSFFSSPEVREFENPVHYTRERWLDFMLSHSHAPRPGDAGYDAYIAEQNELFDRESRGGLLRYDLLTVVTSERV